MAQDSIQKKERQCKKIKKEKNKSTKGKVEAILKHKHLKAVSKHKYRFMKKNKKTKNNQK